MKKKTYFKIYKARY